MEETMIGVIVTIGPSDDLDRARATAVAEKSVPMFEGMPGVRSKVFMWDDETATVTNVYVWDSEEAARAFFTPDLVAMVIELYGAEPHVQYTEISALVDNGAAVGA
jgi:heme-degrading monooxygenase HmoA